MADSIIVRNKEGVVTEASADLSQYKGKTLSSQEAKNATIYGTTQPKARIVTGGGSSTVYDVSREEQGKVREIGSFKGGIAKQTIVTGVKESPSELVIEGYTTEPQQVQTQTQAPTSPRLSYKNPTPSTDFKLMIIGEKASEQAIFNPTQGMSIAQKGLYNINLRQQANVETMSGLSEKYPVGTRASAKDLGKYYGAAASSFALGVVEGVTYPIVYPKETITQTWADIKNPVGAFGKMKSAYQENPSRFFGQMYGGSKLIKFAQNFGGATREGFISVVAKKEPATKYLEPKALKLTEEGKTAFPTVSSMKENLQKFELGRTEKGTVKVVSASPEPIKYFGQSRIIKVGEGTPELASKRTVGLYASYMGGGSPYFFKLSKTEGYSLSLLPKLKTRPTLSVIEGSSIERIPREVLMKGVTEENLFLKEKGSKTSFYVTGNLERQFGKGLPQAFKTSESEVVVPVGSTLKSTSKSIFGFNKRIEVGGRQIPVREYSLVEGKESLGFKNPFKAEAKLKYSKSNEPYYAYSENLAASRLLLLPRYQGISKSPNYSKLSTQASSKIGITPIRESYKPIERIVPTYKPSGKYIDRSFKSSIKIPASQKYSGYGGSATDYSYSYTIPKPPKQPPTSKKLFGYDDSMFGRVGKSYKGKGVRKSYSPSLEAAFFNVKSSKVSLPFAESGLTLRPLIK